MGLLIKNRGLIQTARKLFSANGIAAIRPGTLAQHHINNYKICIINMLGFCTMVHDSAGGAGHYSGIRAVRVEKQRFC
jgi:hypothetical protein